MDEKFRNLLNSRLFIILIALIVLLSWIIPGAEIYGLIILFIIFTLILIFSKDTTSTISILLLFIYSLRDINSFNSSTAPLLLIGFLPIIGLITNIIKFRPTFRKCAFDAPMIAFAVAWLLGGIFFRGINTGFLFSSAFIITIIVAYFFYSSTIEEKGKELLERILFILMVLGGIVALQIMVYYLTVDDIRNSFQYKLMDLGWGGTNNAGAIFCLTIPATFYFVVKQTKGVFFVIVYSVIQYIALLFTLSRGSIIATTLVLGILVIYTLYSSSNRRGVISGITVAMLLIFIVNVALWDYIGDGFSRMFSKGFSDNGRITIFKEGITLFLERPIFGYGIDYKFSEYSVGVPYWFHNTFIQAAVSFGIVGLSAFIYNYIIRFKIIINGKDIIRIYILGAFIAFEGYGLMDTNSLHPLHLILVFLVMIGLDRLNRENEQNNVLLI